MAKLQVPVKCGRVLWDKQHRRYRVLYGGRGSAKSWSVARYLLLEAGRNKIRILCTREIQNSIRDSVYRLLVDQIIELGMESSFMIQREAITHTNGSEFLFKGLQKNINEVKSTEGIDICWVEEAEKVTANSWDVLIPTLKGLLISCRICAIRKTDQAIQIVHKRIRERAIRKQNVPKPETFLYAEYIIVLTTFDKSQFSPSEVLNLYRLRWQIELVFKRFKQLAQLGHLPIHTDESSKAWLYGKLLVALLTEKLIWQAKFISPWGYVIEYIPEK